MKKLFTILILLSTFIMYPQDNKTEVKKQSIEDIIKPYLQKTLDAGEKGVKLLSDEAPVIIKQYLTFEAIDYLFLILIGIGFIMLGKRVGLLFITSSNIEYKENSKYKKITNTKYLDTKDDDETFPYYISLIIGYGIGLLFILNNILEFIKVIFLPKLYLTEQFINLL